MFVPRWWRFDVTKLFKDTQGGSLTVSAGLPAETGRRDEAAVPDKRSGNRVISQLYYNIAGPRLVSEPMALQFVSARQSEGTSLIASRFAAFAAGIEGGSALMIDCNAPPTIAPDTERRPTLAEGFSKSARIDQSITPYEGMGNLHGAALSEHPNSYLHTDPLALGSILDQARQRYRITVLDTPSLEQSPSSLVFARACDAVVLVLEAENTSAEMAEAAIDILERSGGKVLGVVFNKRKLHMPRWLYRRL
jgi:MinD-like ATPase involved in chromosome partitioning or flagellar assembly